MKTCILANMRAGRAERLEELRRRLEGEEGVVWQDVESRSGTVEAAANAAKDGFDLVVAAGGDGTVNAVVNGLMQHEPRPALAILPAGTGNDLARTLAVPLDPAEAFGLVRPRDRFEPRIGAPFDWALFTGVFERPQSAAAFEPVRLGRRRRVDVYLMQSGSEAVYGINAAAGGFSGTVDEALTPEMKETWGPLAYVIGAAGALPEIHDYETRLACDDDPAETVEVLNVVVANGRSVAGGWRVSPLSNLEDGLLDVVVLRLGSVVELGEAAARLIAGDFLTSELVSHRRARTVRVESDPGMWFNVDGELLTREPVTISVVPRALEVVVGPGYRAEP